MTMVQIIQERLAKLFQERLAKLDTLTLDHGSHTDFDDGMCAMEAVAWLAGEEHTDHPACVCPVIGAMMRSANDRMGQGPEADERRARVLRPLLPDIIGSRRDQKVEQQRMWM